MRHSLCRIGIICLAATLTSLLSTPVHAAYTVYFQQEGNNVVATGSGTLDISDLHYFSTPASFPLVDPSFSDVLVGAEGLFDEYKVSSDPPPTFGSGPKVFTTSGTGDLVGISAVNSTLSLLSVPADYISGSALSDTATWDNTTLAALGLDDGSYVWNFGRGADADSYTINIGIAPPTPGSGGSSVPLPPALPLGLLCLGTLAIAAKRHQPSGC